MHRDADPNNAGSENFDDMDRKMLEALVGKNHENPEAYTDTSIGDSVKSIRGVSYKSQQEMEDRLQPEELAARTKGNKQWINNRKYDDRDVEMLNAWTENNIEDKSEIADIRKNIDRCAGHELSSVPWYQSPNMVAGDPLRKNDPSHNMVPADVPVPLQTNDLKLLRDFQPPICPMAPTKTPSSFFSLGVEGRLDCLENRINNYERSARSTVDGIVLSAKLLGALLLAGLILLNIVYTTANIAYNVRN